VPKAHSRRPPNASPGAFSGAECTRRCVAGDAHATTRQPPRRRQRLRQTHPGVPASQSRPPERCPPCGHRRRSDRVTTVIIAKQSISGCTLTLRMHPQMRWGGAGYGCASSSLVSGSTPPHGLTSAWTTSSTPTSLSTRPRGGPSLTPSLLESSSTRSPDRGPVQRESGAARKEGLTNGPRPLHRRRTDLGPTWRR